MRNREKTLICSNCYAAHYDTSMYCQFCMKPLIDEANIIKKVTLVEGDNVYVLEAKNTVSFFGRFDLKEEDKSISRKHIGYYHRDNELYMVDFSSNFTYLDGIQLPKNNELEYKVKVGSKISLNYLEFLVKSIE